jgi:secreted trypsin-like serine protease
MKFSVIVLILFAGDCQSSSDEETCGRSQTPFGIVKSENKIESGEFPWLCAVLEKKTKKFLCNGHLVSKRHVVTSSSCLDQEIEDVIAANIHVVLGKLLLTESDENAQIKNVLKIYKTRQLNREFTFQTVVLLTLQNFVEFSKTVQPICFSSPERNEWKNPEVILTEVIYKAKPLIL